MRRAKPQRIRNTLDLTDRTQVRLVRKRLHLSEIELTKIVERLGNSISMISKEVALQRAVTPSQPASTPAAPVIASTGGKEQTSSEVAVAIPAT